MSYFHQLRITKHSYCMETEITALFMARSETFGITYLLSNWYSTLAVSEKVVSDPGKVSGMSLLPQNIVFDLTESAKKVAVPETPGSDGALGKMPILLSSRLRKFNVRDRFWVEKRL